MGKVPSNSSKSRYIPPISAILLALVAALVVAGQARVPEGGAIVLLALGALAGLAAAHALRVRASSTAAAPAHAEREEAISQLASKLCALDSEEQVARALESSVQSALVCEYVEVQLGGDVSVETTNRRAGSGCRPRPPERATGERTANEVAAVPIAIDAEVFATLRVCKSGAHPLLTPADRALLATVTQLGALALARIRATRELEQRRRQQMAAWRGEREALLETVAAEIAHEVRYPINYFRSLFERAEPGASLDAEDVEIGREEVERLERLVAGLRRMSTHHLERRPVSLRELCARAEVLLSDAFGTRAIEVNVDAGTLVNCDVQQTSQVLVNLLTNALEASGPSGRVGIEFRATSSGGELSVWDTGGGFSVDPARLFAPWYTTKLRGTGLGLSITHRLVRAHGWTIQATRKQDRTHFVIGVRAEDLVSGTTLHRKFLSEAEVA